MPDEPWSPANTSNHEATSRALIELFELAQSEAKQSTCFDKPFNFGPYRLRVRSNRQDAGVFFTHCLAPADRSHAAVADLDLLVLVGAAPQSLIPPTWNFAHTSPRHLERLHLSAESLLSAFYDHDRHYWLILNAAGTQGVFWIASWESVPFWEIAAPFKTLLNWFLTAKPEAMVHGGAVGREGTGVILAGPGGSGKSTLVAACIEQSFSTCGDDLVMLGMSRGSWRAHGIYDALKLVENAEVAPPSSVAAAPSVPCGPKRLVRYSDIRPGSFARSLTISGLVSCSVHPGSAISVSRVEPGEMLRSLAPSTVFLLRGREQHILHKTAQLVRDLPCFHLAMGGSPEDAALFLGAWLAEGPG